MDSLVNREEISQLELPYPIWRSRIIGRFAELRRAGDYAGAVREITVVIERDLEMEAKWGSGNLSAALHARAKTYLLIGDVESALADYRSAREHYRVIDHPDVGACLRLLGRNAEARADWRYEFSKERLREITNMDALAIPLLLLWACQYDGPEADADKKAAIKRLNERKKVKSRLGWWPWEIAYFVLGEVPEELIFEAISRVDQTIRRIRYIQAHFHIAAVALLLEDTERYRHHMTECVALGESQLVESVLAKFYVDKLPARLP